MKPTDKKIWVFIYPPVPSLSSSHSQTSGLHCWSLHLKCKMTLTLGQKLLRRCSPSRLTVVLWISAGSQDGGRGHDLPAYHYWCGFSDLCCISVQCDLDAIQKTIPLKCLSRNPCACCYRWLVLLEQHEGQAFGPRLVVVTLMKASFLYFGWISYHRPSMGQHFYFLHSYIQNGLLTKWKKGWRHCRALKLEDS